MSTHKLGTFGDLLTDRQVEELVSRLNQHNHSAADGGAQVAHGELLGLADDDHAQYLLLAGRSPSQLVTPVVKFGDATNNLEVEADGTVKFNGTATVWKDIMFPQAPPKTTGAGNPTLVTWNGNLRGYAYAVNDVHDFDPQEIEHDAKVGSTATIHVHWISRANDGTDRGVKFEVEYAVEPASGAIPAPTVASFEATVPAGTEVNTPFFTNITTLTIPTIAKLVHARMKRIAATGTAPSVAPVISGLHLHYELDTVGSREITTK